MMMNEQQEQQRQRLASMGVVYRESTTSNNINKDDNKNNNGGNDDEDPQEGLVFLLLPADETAPVQELVLLSPSSSSSSSSPPTQQQSQQKQRLEAFFTNHITLQPGQTIDMAMIQQRADQARTCTTGMCPHVSVSTLQRSAQEGTLQRVAVSHGIPHTNDDDGSSSSTCTTTTTTTTTKIYMYYDEGAVFKQPRLPNARAQTFVTAADRHDDDDEVIYGDVFLTRLTQDTYHTALSLYARHVCGGPTTVCGGPN
eukprot:scaffold336_cov196-Amphora_coffeaeformis.AAC.10